MKHKILKKQVFIDWNHINVYVRPLLLAARLLDEPVVGRWYSLSLLWSCKKTSFAISINTPPCIALTNHVL